MEATELMQGISQVEACADKAKYAVRSGHSPGEVHTYVDSLHQLASQAKKDAARNPDENELRDLVMQIEQVADRALEACRKGGEQVDPQTREAVQRAHAEASKLQRQMSAGSTA